MKQLTKTSILAAIVLASGACAPLAESTSKLAPPPICQQNQKLANDLNNVHSGDSETNVDSKLFHSYITLETNSNDVIREYDDSNGAPGCQKWKIYFQYSQQVGTYCVTDGYPALETP